MGKLEGRRVAVLVTDGFEETELTEPVSALRAAGAKVEIIGEHAGDIQGFRHHDKSITVRADKTIEEVDAEDYDALHLPGGALNADQLRVNQKAKAFVREFASYAKPIAAICHAPWILISAGIARGRTLTGYETIEDDVRNAGGRWVDQPLVEDKNLITSRKPDDLPVFIEAMIRRFTKPVAHRAA